MHTFRVKNGNGGQEMAIVWVTGTIKYTNLEFRKYDTWNIKVDSETSVLNKIRTFLETSSPLGNKWVKAVNFR